MKQVVAADFFCGAGGLTSGLRNAGIEVVKGIDVDPSVKESYEKNNPGSIFLHYDIRKLSADEVMEGINRKGKFLLLAGCAPCQPFTHFKKKAKFDRRKSLMLHFARLIEKIKPELVLAENVPGFMKNPNRYRKEFLRILDKNGYEYVESIINAADYGVPQRRERYLIMASRIGKVYLPQATHGEGRKPYVTVRKAIAKYPPLLAGQKSKLVPNHSCPTLSPTNLQRIKSIPKNGGTRQSLPKKLKLRCHEDHRGHTDVYGRMSWDDLAPTLTCRCISLSNGRFGHPTQNRAISVREAAALQTFSDDYIFYGMQTKAAMHVGNAVPVLLGEKWGDVFVQITKRWQK